MNIAIADTVRIGTCSIPLQATCHVVAVAPGRGKSRRLGPLYQVFRCTTTLVLTRDCHVARWARSAFLGGSKVNGHGLAHSVPSLSFPGGSARAKVDVAVPNTICRASSVAFETTTDVVAPAASAEKAIGLVRGDEASGHTASALVNTGDLLEASRAQGTLRARDRVLYS